MADIVDQKTRSRMMSGIGPKNTKPERVLRRALHRLGFRFSLHGRRLPGSPDIVLPRHRAVVLVHGCFWHRHNGCRYTTTPGTNPEFWQTKFAQNVARDARNVADLTAAGWRVATVWECHLRTVADVESAAERVGRWLVSARRRLELPRPAPAEC
ncbi:DNA mismatch endonuclease Vsr [Luteitalea sp.]|uniref:very short patch repair endonuclease n=1 Tax=Luteitalea sp. TaxID=2004800 RepID=UPI00345992F3